MAGSSAMALLSERGLSCLLSAFFDLAVGFRMPVGVKGDYVKRCHWKAVVGRRADEEFNTEVLVFLEKQGSVSLAMTKQQRKHIFCTPDSKYGLL